MSVAPTSVSRTSRDIPGWFFWLDRQLFAVLLRAQHDQGPGDLVELGTYLGKSAVVIGDYVRPGERFVALDLFGRTDLVPGDRQNQREVEKSYQALTRPAFEENYLSRHPRLPVIVEGPSSVIMNHVSPGSVRFVHIDASHLYEHVRRDAEHAKIMVQSGGLVVFDDWRSEHTPGVTAAVWEAVFGSGLVPVAVSPSKFYGVFSDPEPHRTAIRALLAEDANHPKIASEVQDIAGHPVLRLRPRDQPAAPTPSRSDSGLANAELAQLLMTAVYDASTITRIRRRLGRRGHRRPRP